MSTNASATNSADAAARMHALHAMVEDGLASLLKEHAGEPGELYGPVRYALEQKGKRLRPLLALLTCEACGGKAEDALPAALAVEVFHTFTLVHDDIMDHAETRRGRAAVHRQYDENKALLAGDYLMGLSYDLLARAERAELRPMIRSFHRMVARLCEGQALDEAFESRTEVTKPEYLDMIAGKTGALIAFAMEAGARTAAAPDAFIDSATTAGAQLGRAFQIQDDYLDLMATDPNWGKPIGGDLVQAKWAYLLLHTLEVAQGEDHAWFARIHADGGLDPALVDEARTRMERLGVIDHVRSRILDDYVSARTLIEAFEPTAGRDGLLALVGRMQRRLT
ncbi:MAG: polyprenyl synthetase family protein [Bacteroidota bacterium]